MIYVNKKGELQVIPHKKKTYQGKSARTKFCQRGSRPRRKAYRGQGKG